MGASLSLAVFAALVAAITVVASMTVIAAVGLLFYSSVRGDEASGYESLTPIYDATEHGMTFREGPLPLNESIDARRLVGFFDEEESSLSHFDPSRSREPDPAYGSPEWTEEEGATEIFSAHEAESSVAALADFEVEEPTRLTEGYPGAAPAASGGMVGAGHRTG